MTKNNLPTAKQF